MKDTAQGQLRNTMRRVSNESTDLYEVMADGEPFDLTQLKYYLRGLHEAINRYELEEQGVGDE